MPLSELDDTPSQVRHSREHETVRFRDTIFSSALRDEYLFQLRNKSYDLMDSKKECENTTHNFAFFSGFAGTGVGFYGGAAVGVAVGFVPAALVGIVLPPAGAAIELAAATVGAYLGVQYTSELSYNLGARVGRATCDLFVK